MPLADEPEFTELTGEEGDQAAADYRKIWGAEISDAAGEPEE